MNGPRHRRAIALGRVPWDRLVTCWGLPIRPRTARFVLGLDPAPRAPRNGRSQDRPPTELDPGWRLAMFLRPDNRASELVEISAWWPKRDGRAAEAVDRLWRFSVATALAARRLANAEGDPNPDETAALGLLQPLGLWALAWLDPDRLADWFVHSLSENQLDWEYEHLGDPLDLIGQRLALGWGAPWELVEAVRLADEPPKVIERSASDPERIDRLRRARLQARRTPWAPGAEPRRGPADPETRWLTAAVQVRCSGGLAADDDLQRAAADHDGDPEERRVRNLAGRAVRLDRALSGWAAAGGAHGEGGRRNAEPPSAEDSPETRLKSEQQKIERIWESLIPNQEISIFDSSNGDERAARLEALAEFAAGAAHELNNPLAVVVGRAQLILARVEDPSAQQGLRTIIAQAKRANQLLKDLIYVARPPKPRLSPCNPDQMLRSAVEDLQTEAAARGVRLDVRLNGPAFTLLMDIDGLKHLADILIRNALEATPGGAAVEVRSDLNGNRLIWTVADTGAGLDERARAHLLDPFYCGREAGRGLGLGLPRAARFLERLGGSLSWTDRPTGGTLTTAVIPLPETPEAPSARP